jgi:hypothetical protein
MDWVTDVRPQTSGRHTLTGAGMCIGEPPGGIYGRLELDQEEEPPNKNTKQAHAVLCCLSSLEMRWTMAPRSSPLLEGSARPRSVPGVRRHRDPTASGRLPATAVRLRAALACVQMLPGNSSSGRLGRPDALARRGARDFADITSSLPGLLFDESEYEQLRKHYLEKKQYRDATLPHNGMRLRRQVRPAIIDSNTPWTCSPLPPAPGTPPRRPRTRVPGPLCPGPLPDVRGRGSPAPFARDPSPTPADARPRPPSPGDPLPDARGCASPAPFARGTLPDVRDACPRPPLPGDLARLLRVSVSSSQSTNPLTHISNAFKHSRQQQATLQRTQTVPGPSVDALHEMIQSMYTFTQET